MEENKKSYFGEIGSAMKTLAIGMKTTWKELLTKKSTEQYPENRKTTLHVAARHRGRLVMNRDENGVVKCTACTLCEKLARTALSRLCRRWLRTRRQARRKSSS